MVCDRLRVRFLFGTFEKIYYIGSFFLYCIDLICNIADLRCYCRGLLRCPLSKRSEIGIDRKQLACNLIGNIFNRSGLRTSLYKIADITGKRYHDRLYDNMVRNE